LLFFKDHRFQGKFSNPKWFEEKKRTIKEERRKKKRGRKERKKGKKQKKRSKKKRRKELTPRTGTFRKHVSRQCI